MLLSGRNSASSFSPEHYPHLLASFPSLCTTTTNPPGEQDLGAERARGTRPQACGDLISRPSHHATIHEDRPLPLTFFTIPAMSLVHPLGRALAAIFLFVTFVHGQTCYYPGGLESGHTACGSSEDGEASACCGEEATCLGSGLCFSHGIMSRGSCTDKDWKDEACATVCTQGEAFIWEQQCSLRTDHSKASSTLPLP